MVQTNQPIYYVEHYVVVVPVCLQASPRPQSAAGGRQPTSAASKVSDKRKDDIEVG